MDADGRVAARTGELNQSWAGHHIGDGYVALGNSLVGEQVVAAMAAAFEKHEANELEDRLLLAVESGLAIGGEKADMTPWHSAAVLVYGNDPFPRVDLRVDEHPTAVAELRRHLGHLPATIGLLHSPGQGSRCCPTGRRELPAELAIQTELHNVISPCIAE